MTRTSAPYFEALLGVVAVAWLTSAQLSVIGLASSALLFLLPVLLASTRGGIGPGLLAALAGASAYNYFLLEPRYTFNVHELDNLVSVFVLVAVALVTSRLASRLMTREGEAQERARLSAESAELSGLLAGLPAQTALANGIAYIESRYGKFLSIVDAPLPVDDASFSSLDLAAAAWASHNGDMTGHGSENMPASDWTFLPLAPKNSREGRIAALAAPMDGATRPPSELEHLRQLSLLLGQCIDRDELECERRERELLEERDHLRRTFLASLAHDFRTPLTVISGRLANLAQRNPEAHDALVAAQRLDHMMTDLIGAARIEGGSVAPILESMDLVDVVGAACDGIAVPTHLSLVRNIPTDLPFIKSDAVLLHHVLTNLIDNAFRHACSSVQICATHRNGRVGLEVRDDGPGVPVAERERIFDRFERIEGSDRTDGSGLGLAIVKGFADAMSITVAVDDAPAGGARFLLEFPVSGSLQS